VPQLSRESRVIQTPTIGVLLFCHSPSSASGLSPGRGTDPAAVSSTAPAFKVAPETGSASKLALTLSALLPTLSA
jgi:hypothetical protein